MAVAKGDAGQMLRSMIVGIVGLTLVAGCRTSDDSPRLRRAPSPATDTTSPGDVTGATEDDKITVTMQPRELELAAGATHLFLARVEGTPYKDVIWSVQEGKAGGTVVNGNYQAPGYAGTFHVEAASRKNTQKVAVATVRVTVAPPPPEKWLALTSINGPALRSGHSAVWTGSEMIVWGGRTTVNTFINTGARYNTAFDSWQGSTSLANAPKPLYSHTAVWTGSEMIVWGREAGAAANTGWRYSPAADTWTPVTAATAVEARYDHTAVWTGSEMIVWGGRSTCVPGCGLQSGGRYSPSLDAWSPVTTAAAPAGRTGHTAVWTGSEMIVWGGQNAGLALQTGGRYAPASNTWQATSLSGAPAARHLHTAVWSGTQMLVWGGTEPEFGNTFYSGARYSPGTDSWSAMTTLGAPQGRSRHAAIWTGTRMLIWGGTTATAGARYAPGDNTWSPMTTSNAPDPRTGFSAVWTGAEMLIWGGEWSGELVPAGSRYTP